MQASGHIRKWTCSHTRPQIWTKYCNLNGFKLLMTNPEYKASSSPLLLLTFVIYYFIVNVSNSVQTTSLLTVTVHFTWMFPDRELAEPYARKT